MSATIFEMSAILRLDRSQYDRELNAAESEAQSKGSKIGSIFSTLGKVAAVGLTASFAAVSAVVTKSIKEYAEYEQLWGGVQKLYGTAGQSIEEYAKSVGKSVDQVRGEYSNLETAQNVMLQQANDAYKTSGLSANAYMQQATGFSAALIKSLNGDTVAAAKQTDVAMRAMSDNINTYGQDAESVQNAFQGFARENFTMLDNLRLGYGGSREGMLSLIADANEYAKSMGMAGDLTIDSFSDIVTAIDLIQQKQNIAGTTAREAASTISGSFGMLGAAWENLITGMSNKEADLSKLIKNVVDSLKAVVTNLAPVIKQAIKGVTTLLKEIAPLISSELPGIVSDILPDLLSAAVSLITGLAAALPALFQSIVETIPVLFEQIKTSFSDNQDSFIESGKSLIDMISTGITEGIPNLIEVLVGFLPTLIEGLYTSFGVFIEVGGEIVSKLIEGLLSAIPNILSSVYPIVESVVTGIVSNLPKLLEAGTKIIESLVTGIQQMLPKLPQIIIDTLNNVIALAKSIDWIGLGIQIIQFIVNGITTVMSLVPTIIKTIFDLAVSLVTGIDWLGLGKFLITTIVSGIKALFTIIPQALLQIGQQAMQNFQSIDWLGLGSRVINFIVNGIRFLMTSIPQLLQTIGNNAVSLFQSIDWLGLGSKVITFIVNGIKSLITAIPDALKSIGQKAFDAFKNINWLSLGTNIITGVVNGIKGAAHKVTDIMKNLASGALDTVKSFLGIKSPSRVFRDQVGKNIGLGVAEGIEDTYQKVNLAMESLISIPDKYDFDKSFVFASDSNNTDYNSDVVRTGDVYNININQPVDTPDEIARAIRTESQYGLIGGAAIG